jgi:hypothetical protein
MRSDTNRARVKKFNKKMMRNVTVIEIFIKKFLVER